VVIRRPKRVKGPGISILGAEYRIVETWRTSEREGPSFRASDRISVAYGKGEEAAEGVLPTPEESGKTIT